LAAICRPADANAQARKALRAQTLSDGANAIVTCSTTTGFDGNFADSALEIVMHYQTFRSCGAKVLQCLANRLARIIHGALGPKVRYL
jgi:hypothetical protein